MGWEEDAGSLAASYTFAELLALARDEGICMHHAQPKDDLARAIAASWSGEGTDDGR